MSRSLKIILAFNTLSFILYQINAVNDVAIQWCQRTQRPYFCYKIVAADYRDYLRTSPEGLTRIIVDKALIISVANMGKISGLIKKSTGTYNQILRDCFDGYYQAHDILQHANLSFIDHQTYRYVAEAVSYPYHRAADCEQEFKQSVPAFPSPLTQENKLLEDVIYVAMEIINLKVCNHIGVCWG